MKNLKEGLTGEVTDDGEGEDKECREESVVVCVVIVCSAV